MRRCVLDWPFGWGSDPRVPPAWPHSGLRLQPLWEHDFERFDGETALRDLGPGDAAASAWVLARYLAVRLALRGAAGTADVVERAHTAGYVSAAAGGGGEEAEPLLRVVSQAGRPPRAELLSALQEAGEAAARRGHASGGFALLRTAYLLALQAGRPADGALAARAVQRLAAAECDGRRGSRLWARRARLLERQAAG